MDELTAPLDSIKGIGPSTLRAFNRLGIFSVDDLLTTLPFRSEDRTKIVNISQLSPGNACVIQVKIVSTSARKSKNGVLIIQANVEDDSGKIPALWFNQRYLLRMH